MIITVIDWHNLQQLKGTFIEGKQQ